MQLDNKILILQVEELARILNTWIDQIVVGGGVALVLYDEFLAKSHAGVVGTNDIDFLIPRKPIKPGNDKISTILKDNGYEIKFRSLEKPSVESFTKQLNDTEIEVEFLTDNKSRTNENVVEIHDAGVNAQALSYIAMSLSEVMPLILPSGNKINLVRPEAWVLHKGLTFPKRTQKFKIYKDLYGIWFVLSKLNEISEITKANFSKLLDRQPKKWTETFYSNINIWTSSATPEDWNRLEQQDLGGRLSKNNFLQVIKQII